MADIAQAMEPFDPEMELDEGGVEVEIPAEDMIESEEEPPSRAQHRENLAAYIDEKELASLATDLVELYEVDDRSRQEWLKAYTDGLDYLGFKSTDRTRPFKGASGVFHPVMAESVVRFQSNAIVEIFPASGPVRTKLMGDETPEKVKQGQRIEEEMNYQLTENMTEYRSEMEQLLFRLPLAGSVFKKVYFDPLKLRPTACMVPAEDFVINYGATDLDNAERFTHVMRKSKNEYKKLVRAGFYLNYDLPLPVPTVPEGKEKENKITGIDPTGERDDRYVILEMHAYLDLPPPFDDPDGVADPYIIHIEKNSSKVLAIYRNWLEEDETRSQDEYFIHYQYMPGLGFYGTGLTHLQGSIAKGATSIMRQLIDAGTLSNLPGGLKTKGLRMQGTDEPIQPGEWRDVSVPAGAIRDNFLPLPYKEPSPTLMALLTNLVDEGRRIGSIADVEIGSSQANAPVGTTMALLERSLKVMSAVHARLHASLRKELKLIARCIYEYMPPQYSWDLEGRFNRQQDFDGRVDILPVSDPNAATQAQRIVQMQAVQQLAAMNPELYNMKELHRAGLEVIGVKNDERILPIDQPPPRMDPVQENMAVLTGQPIQVFPDQDHTAHLQVHLSAINDPKILEMVGKSPNAMKLMGQMEAHMAEHLAYQYREEIQQEMGVELPPMGEELPPEVENRLARLVADASVRLRERHEAEAAEKQAEEIATDPVFQLRERELALKERKQAADEQADKRDAVIDIAKNAAKEMLDLRRIESEETRAGAKIGADLVTFGAQLESEERREGVALGKEIAENIRSDQRDVQKMEQDATDRTEERMLQLLDRREERATKEKIARSKPKPAAKK